jgi:hypothetical protein
MDLRLDTLPPFQPRCHTGASHLLWQFDGQKCFTSESFVLKGLSKPGAGWTHESAQKHWPKIWTNTKYPGLKRSGSLKAEVKSETPHARPLYATLVP